MGCLKELAGGGGAVCLGGGTLGVIVCFGAALNPENSIEVQYELFNGFLKFYGLLAVGLLLSVFGSDGKPKNGNLS